jgi:hypothetical protein
VGDAEPTMGVEALLSSLDRSPISIFDIHFIFDILNTGTLRRGGVGVKEPSGQLAVIGPGWPPPQSG